MLPIAPTLATALAALSLLAPRAAGAAEEPPRERLFWLAGVAAGASIVGDSPRAGFILGAEGSLAWQPVEPIAALPALLAVPWLGVYADALWDFGPDAPGLRFTVGPEGGLGVLGVDGGYVGAVRDGALRHGWAVRVVGTLGFVLFGVRLERLPPRGTEPGETILEMNGLFKLSSPFLRLMAGRERIEL